jgi:NitT/TauT family transport system substrate-binding protein
MLQTRRATVEKFLRAYRRGATDYAAALLRRDRYGKRVTDVKSQSAATLLARYVYPGHSLGPAVATIEAGIYFMDPQARLDAADIARQVEWYKAQGLVEPVIDVRAIVDSSLAK